MLMRRFFSQFVIPLSCLLPVAFASGPLSRGDISRGGDLVEHPPAARSLVMQAERLVEQLGAVSYERREQAVHLLKQIGAAALPSLRHATRHGDLEIRYRARQLLDDIERVERKRILEEFLTSGNPKLGDLLPGWRRYTEIVGKDTTARELFAGMYHAEPDIMRLADSRGPELRNAVEERNREFNRTKRRSHSLRMSPETLAVFLFVMLDPEIDVSGRASSMMNVVLGQSAIRQALVQPGDTAFRRLMSRWIAEADDVSPTQRMAVAVQYWFDAGVVPSLQLIRSGARGSQIQNAIFSVAKLGGPEHLADLEPLLRDDAILSQRQSKATPGLRSRIRNVTELLNDPHPLPSPDDAVPSKRPGDVSVVFSSQVRDVALVAMVLLSGQNPLDYGFSELQPDKTGKYLYSANTAGFASEERRQQALSKWRLWAKVQRLQSLKIDETAVEGAGV